MELIFDILFIIILVSACAILAHFVCDKRKPNLNKMSFRETMDLCDLPIVTFLNNGNKFNFLLDTGASKSVINTEVLQSMSYKEANISGNVYGLDGKKYETSYVNVFLNYRGREYEEEFQVLDMSAPFGNLKSDFGIKVHGILSSSFFEKYRYILDYNELVAYSVV